MAINIAFKKLFRVEILHEHYLNNGFSSKADKQEAGFFEIYDKKAEEDANRIENTLSKYSISQDIEFVPTEKTRQFLRRQRMIMRQDKKGFFIAVEVKDEKLPFIPLAEGDSMSFQIRLKNPEWVNFTAMKVRQRMPVVYYFDNVNDSGEKEYPSLSLLPPPINKSVGHEMGELVRNGNQIMEIFIKEDGTGDPKEIKPQVLYATENDRKLLSPNFLYVLPKDEFYNKAEVSFTDMAGEKKAEQKYELQEPTNRCRVDGSNLPPGQYVFSIKTDRGFSEEKKIIIDDSLYSGADKRHSVLGVIRIFHKKGLGNFGILNDDGTIKSEENKFGNTFQLRFKNRATYRRYFLPIGFEFESELDFEKAKIKYDPEKNPHFLQTIDPVPLTKKPAKISIETKEKKGIILKNPVELTIASSKGRYVSNIYLSESDLVAKP